jgi:hypothetical protein
VLDPQTVDRTLGETEDRNVVTEDANALTMTDQPVEIALDGRLELGVLYDGLPLLAQSSAISLPETRRLYFRLRLGPLPRSTG